MRYLQERVKPVPWGRSPLADQLRDVMNAQPTTTLRQVTQNVTHAQLTLFIKENVMTPARNVRWGMFPREVT
jgi:hypothetical protein